MKKALPPNTLLYKVLFNVVDNGSLLPLFIFRCNVLALPLLSFSHFVNYSVPLFDKNVNNMTYTLCQLLQNILTILNIICIKHIK